VPSLFTTGSRSIVGRRGFFGIRRIKCLMIGSLDVKKYGDFMKKDLTRIMMMKCNIILNYINGLDKIQV
jgi:hypothetical protein